MDSVAEWTNEEILSLWEKYSGRPECQIKQVPLVFHELKKNSLLFVGINPSSSEIGFRKIAKRTSRTPQDIEPFLPWKDKASVNLKELTSIERDAWEHHDYFSKFRSMGQRLNQEWSHIDLFFYRMRSQQEFKKIIYNKGKLTDFAEEQLKIASKTIDHMMPRAIVVANALACDIMRERFPSLREPLDRTHGCHLYQLADGKRVPTFLASMLTGQRALDKGSFDRLVWQVERVLEKDL